ncbi:hypothetical protein SAMN02799624_04549 [Paenibacillus sp. UNC496MF]|uniref:hypothetical protein n=1 Tax=Paenibacillus sp. UNC496MF TaxID=1502753 RepID=UPI0008F1EA74|nr:hypothetical protein [Paenibacillus sp. UNC496MF]SFJ44501.1 hypothetical protein SAMN02799624_04549 [Paenibacillus sp. UNC496MF]
MKMTAQAMLQKLADYFAKHPESNIGKLMGIIADQLAKLEATQNRIRDWRDINQAQGTTLERIGENVAQPRGVASDDIYRVLIKSKIARNFSKGDINTIISVLAIALNADPSEIQIRELYQDPVSPEPAAISIVQLPIDKINAVGMSPLQFSRIVQRTVAAGVQVSKIEFTGTFAFASAGTSESDPAAGFSDLAGTTGGTLSAVYVPAEDNDLPI